MVGVDSIQKAIEYMEENILEDITIESIAKQVNVSTFHFQRTFAILKFCRRICKKTAINIGWGRTVDNKCENY
jgi:AraC-like DNA-binding protein